MSQASQVPVKKIDKIETQGLHNYLECMLFLFYSRTRDYHEVKVIPTIELFNQFFSRAMQVHNSMV